MPKPNRQKVHYVLTEDLLPEVMGDHIGEFYVARAEGTIWYVSGSGAVVSLIDLLRDAKPVAPPRHGKDGKDGASVLGPRGFKGESGRDGRDGKDGVGYSGPQGPSGRPGKDCQCKTELAERTLASVEQKLADARAEFGKQIAELKYIVNALLDANKKGQEYITFLRSRVAAKRQEKNNGL